MTTVDTEASIRRRPRWVRVLRWLLAGLLVLLVAAALYVAYLWWRVPSDRLDPLQPGELAVQTEASTSEIGPFTVSLTTGAQAALTVTRGDQEVWRSEPGVAFLAASKGTVDFVERFGYFWPQVDRETRYPDQTIAALVSSASEVTLSGLLLGGGSETDYTLTLRAVDQGPDVTALRMEAKVGQKSDGLPVTSVQLTAGRSAGTAIHGLGEQYRPFNLDGTITPILPREQGIGRGEQPISFLADITNWAAGNKATTYAAWPSWVTESNQAFTLAPDVTESGAFAIADFSDPTQIRLESWDSWLFAEVYAAESGLDVIAARAAGGVRQPLAEWTQQGAVLGLQGGTDRVTEIVDEMLAAGTAISAVWLQDWTGQRQTSFGDRLWWTWQLDEDRYPGWDQLVSDFAAQDIKVLTYVNPWLVNAAEKGDPSIRNLFGEAEQAGYLVRNPEGGTYLMDQNGFDAALVDFTNPAARDWYADVIATEVIGQGAAGFMADFGEALPFDAVLHRGSPLIEHNRYPQEWAAVVRQACDQAGLEDCVAFMRSSFLQSPEQVPLMWAGDQLVNFAPEDGLASAVYGMLSGGVSGFPLWHSDIGGYTSINAVVKNYVRPPDLNQRWAELESFGVFMRTHEGNRPAANAQVYDTPESRAAFAKSSQIFAALASYRESVLAEAVEQGLPAIRHSWLVYPGTAAASADLQFFLGNHLLVAPVTAEGAESVTVTFPPGDWVHVLTGEGFSGDQTVAVSAPLGTPAAFVQTDDPVGQEIVDSLRTAGVTQ